MIAMQSSGRRPPVPPDRLPPPDVPAREQRLDADERAELRSTQFQQLLEQLEAGYEFHTMQLARLRPRAADSNQALDRGALVAASRHALTVIAAALRDMAEGRYGICASCNQEIPVQRLEACPEARHCLRCQTSAAV